MNPQKQPTSPRDQEMWRKTSPHRPLVFQPQTLSQGLLQFPEQRQVLVPNQLQQTIPRRPSVSIHVSDIQTRLNQQTLANQALVQENKSVVVNYNRLVDENREYRSQIQFFRSEFGKLRSHITSTESVKHQAAKLSKHLEEEKAKTQKYINENNRLVHQIKGIKALLESERLLFHSLQKEKDGLRVELQALRRQKDQKTMIINQSRLLFEDERRQLQAAKQLEDAIRNYDIEIREFSHRIQVIKSEQLRSPSVLERESEVIRELQTQLEGLRVSHQNYEEHSARENVDQKQPIIRNLKIIFGDQKSTLMKQLSEKEQRLVALTNRLQSLTLGDSSVNSGYQLKD